LAHCQLELQAVFVFCEAAGEKAQAPQSAEHEEHVSLLLQLPSPQEGVGVGVGVKSMQDLTVAGLSAVVLQLFKSEQIRVC